MSKVKVHTKNLRLLNKRLQDMSKQAAERIAAKVASALTTRTQAAYDSGVSVYGDARSKGLSLYKTGAVRSAIGFTSVGTIVRAVLNQPYAKYLIGKYGILPNGNAALPVEWTSAINAIIKNEFDAKKRSLRDAA